MSDQRADFHNRLRQVGRKHEAFAREGYTARLRSDGLIEVVPAKPARSRFSARVIILFFAAVLLFKGLLIASLGFESYDRRVAELSLGTAVEQAGAFVMQADPISKLIATQIGPILR